MNKLLALLVGALVFVSVGQGQQPPGCTPGQPCPSMSKEMPMPVNMQAGMPMQHQCKCMQGMGMMPMAMGIDLKLSDDQQKQIDELEYNSAIEMAKSRAEIDISKISLDFEMKKDPPDEAKIKGLIKKIGELETNLKIAEVSKMIKIGKILTPEQRKMMKSSKCCQGMGMK